jgi:hypothetical protein
MKEIELLFLRNWVLEVSALKSATALVGDVHCKISDLG